MAVSRNGRSRPTRPLAVKRQRAHAAASVKADARRRDARTATTNKTERGTGNGGAQSAAGPGSGGLGQLLRKFESLGDNCEFGLVQRKAGIEPVYLLRFAGFEIPV